MLWSIIVWIVDSILVELVQPLALLLNSFSTFPLLILPVSLHPKLVLILTCLAFRGWAVGVLTDSAKNVGSSSYLNELSSLRGVGKSEKVGGFAGWMLWSSIFHSQ